MRIEQELAFLIWVLYAVDCIHWLGPGQAALTRRINGTWKIARHSEGTFTLLGRMPVLVAPLDLRPGFVVSNSTDLPEGQSGIETIGDKVEDLEAHTRILTALAILAAANLLIIIPVLLFMQWFEGAWAPIGVLAACHVAIAAEVFRLSGDWRAEKDSNFWQHYIALVLNPAAALRAGDLFSERLKIAVEVQSPVAVR
ncbi:MAG TPA: hypothetical protein VKB38_07170 [Terracidiphilus sp.]|nr:hypothetical protein [Terracidiphilus sp.]